MNLTKSEAATFNTYDTHTPPRPRFQPDPAPFLKLPEGKSLGIVMCVDISGWAQQSTSWNWFSKRQQRHATLAKNSMKSSNQRFQMLYQR